MLSLFLKFDRNKKLARAVDVMMARVKRIYIFDNPHKRGIFLSFSRSDFQIETLVNVWVNPKSCGSMREKRKAGSVKQAVA